MIRDDDERRVTGGAQMFGAVQHGTGVEETLGQHLMDPAREGIRRVVVAVAAGLLEPAVEGDEGLDTRGIDDLAEVAPHGVGIGSPVERQESRDGVDPGVAADRQRGPPPLRGIHRQGAMPVK